MIGRSLVRREVREEYGQATTWGTWAGETSPSATSWSGSQVNNNNATSLLTVYGCTRFIADSIAAFPVDVKRKEADGSRSERPVPDWLRFPIQGLDWTAFCTQLLVSLLLDGNAFFYVNRSRGADPIELVPLDPTTVDVKREGGVRRFYIHGQRVTNELIHIPGIMAPGKERGLSPVEAARQTIGAAMAAQEAGSRFLGQGMSLGGVLEVPTPLPPDNVKRMARDFARLHGGKTKAGSVAVLEGGTTWKSTSVTPEQAQFLETRNYSASEIAGQMFLIDPSDLGIGHLTGSASSLTYANLEQRNTRRVQITFMPWIIRLENAITPLLGGAGDVMKLNTDAVLRGDTAARSAYYSSGIKDGWLLANEVRALEDLPPLPAGVPAPPGGVNDQIVEPVSQGVSNAGS